MSMEFYRWRKATASGQETDCIEVAHTMGVIRDSKNTAGPMLSVSVAQLVRVVKGNQLGR